MSRKDVELVIRAKDEATKAVNAITAAINSLSDSQDDLTKGASKSETALSRLGASFSELDKQLRGATLGEKVARSLDNATKSVNRLEGAVESTTKELNDLRSQSEQAAASQDRLSAKAKEAAASVSREADALTKAKKSLADQNTELRTATKDRDSLIRADARLTDQIEKQRTRLDAAIAKHRELGAEIGKVEQPTARLATSFQKAEQAVARQQQKLDELVNEQGTVQAAIGQTSAAVERFTQDVAQATAAIARQETVLAGAQQEHTESQAAVRAGAQQQKQLEQAVENTSDSLEAQKAALDRAQTEMAQLTAAAGRADAALADLAAGSTSQLQTAFNASRRAMLETRREWVQSEAAVKKLAEGMVKVGPPTREQALAWNAATTASRTAKAEYLAQREGLARLSQILRQTGGDVDALRARQAAFQQVMAQTGASVAKLRDEAGRSVAAFEKQAAVTTRATNETRKLVQETNRITPRPVNALAEAYRKLYGETRQAMSWTQRLRGEVLSLVSAYGGIYGVINLLGQTVTAFQTLEAATSRLTVVMGGDVARTEQELDFLRRTADRLGISFGDLAQEYSKFAVATQGTILEGENTRRIFVSVAEAARVNKISMDQVRGVFVALTQIVSKGAVQMEELRQQLGDRLPGAIQIMADGLGVGTDELIKMMEQGQVSSSALIGFAEELDRRFGSQLAAALRTTTAEMGKFQNAAFQSLVAFGEAGFIESFTDLLRDLTETLRSAEFQSFIARVSQAFGVLIDVLGLAVRNFDLVVIAMSAFVAVKVAPFISALLVSMVNLVGGMGAVRTAIAATIISFRGMASTAGLSATAITRLSFALRALLSTTGIGLALTAISIAIGFWATRADDATAALIAHREVVDRVRNAYERAGGAVDGWKEKLDGLTATQARSNLITMEQQLRDAQAAFERVIPKDIFGNAFEAPVAGGYIKLVNDLFEEFKAGGVTIEDFRSRLDALSEEYRDMFPINARLAQQFDEQARALEEAARGTAEARDVVIALTGTEAEASAALGRLNNRLGESGSSAATAAEGLKTYTDAINKLKEAIPELAEQMKYLKDVQAIEDSYQAAIQNATSIGQVNQAYELRQRALAALEATRYREAEQALGRFTDGVEAAAELIRQREGFIATPEWDVNAYRVGFGSDTITLSDGTVRQVTQGISTTVADANRDLYRRIGEFQQTIIRQIGGDRWAGMNPQQQAALTSIAYNYGSLPADIVAAIRTGSVEGVQAAIRARGDDNGGINRERRNTEAAIYGSRAGEAAQTQAYIQEQERLVELERRRAEEAAKFHEARAEAIQQAEFELSVADQELIARETALAIRQAENEARRAGTELTDEERAAIARVTEEKYRQQAIDERNAEIRRQATEAEQEVNNLLSRRQALQEQLAIYQERGDVEKVAELRAEINQVNEAYLRTIDAAIAMWEAVGGTGADAAIEKLRQARLEAQGFSADAKQGYIDWKRVGDLFASGLANAFDRFAQAVAEGTSVGEAARDAFLQFAADFLRQIAQMIIQQAILNALRSFFPGFFGAGHTGGLVGSNRIGSGNQTRRVDPAVFAGAQRFHSGGPVGLRPGEVPAILKKNEEVLTDDDPRNILNGGVGRAMSDGAPAPAGDTKVINMFDAASFLSEALNSKVGERAILNWVRANPAAFRNALGGS